MLIVNTVARDRGWSPIHHMVSLAAEMFDCDVMAADSRGISKTRRALSVLRQRRRSKGREDACLIVCMGPTDLLSLLNIENWRNRFGYLAAWIIDSFWLDYIPSSIRLRNPFDHFFVTSLEDVDPWRRITGIDTTWLPWGTDALRLGHDGASRAWDVTRVGRQPPEWDDDLEATKAAEALGIQYRGRPDSSGLDELENQKLMMSAYGATKFTLAFSNAVNRDPNNHPSREYLTGRWVDALGSGSVVAGVAPRGPNTDGLLWPGATLELGGIRRAEGMRMIAAALRQWKPHIATMNYRMALERLDWRWRFHVLADKCEIRSELLTLELQSLEQRIAGLKALQIVE